jgi:hypothetical protein
MVRSLALAGVAGVLLAGCQTADPRYYYTDQDCLTRQNSSRVLAAVTGIGLGVAGVPGGGIVGLGVGLATNPHCQAYHLTPEGRERIRQDIIHDRMARERGERARLRGPQIPEADRQYLNQPPASGRPLDNIPSNSPTPASTN